MKKYIITYVILYAILLCLFLTHGIPYGNIVRESIISTVDAQTTTWTLLTYNIIIALIILVAGIVVSCLKENKIRFKWLFPVSMLALIIALVPIVKILAIGGFSGSAHYEFYYSLVTSYFM